jgi:methyl-accepting chemotaxis protein
MQATSDLLSEHTSGPIQELLKVCEDAEGLVQKHINDSHLDGADELTQLISALKEEIESLQQNIQKASELAGDLGGRA